MRPIKFKKQTTTIAKNQKPYLPLPAYVSPDGQVISCWKLLLKERIKLLFTGKLWLTVLTSNHPLQPIKTSIIYPFIKIKKEMK